VIIAFDVGNLDFGLGQDSNPFSKADNSRLRITFPVTFLGRALGVYLDGGMR
jgi:hypothetical protein